MTRLTFFLAAAAATAVVAVPAAAQQPYPYPYPQQAYPQQGYPRPSYPQQGYPQQGYPQQQSAIGQIINQLLGNRYQPNDRLAVERCATAAMVEAGRRYPPNAYGQAYGYQQQRYGYPQQAYQHNAGMRVTAITDVRRQRSGLRVAGLIDSRGGNSPYGNAYGNAYGQHNQAYAADLSFRCNVDYRGAVTNVRLARQNAAYPGR